MAHEHKSTTIVKSNKLVLVIDYYNVYFTTGGYRKNSGLFIGILGMHTMKDLTI